MVKKAGTKTEMAPACRDYTLNMHKRLQGIAFKKRSTRAVREIRRFAAKEMHTESVKIDTMLNRFCWSNGVRNVPRLIRVRITRSKNEDEDSKHAFVSTVQLLEVKSFENLATEKKEA